MRGRLAAALAMLAVEATALAADPLPLPCAWTDKACGLDAARKHPLQWIDAWREAFAKPVEKRFGPASPALVQRLALDNIANGFRERPRAASPDAGFMRDVREALADLPPAVRAVLGPDFAGVYFVEELGGTGYTDVIHEGERPVGAYIVLDAGVLSRHRANGWATWKESTPFRPHPGITLKSRIQPDSADTRKHAIQYILLHELGHVLSVRHRVHPEWKLSPKEVPQSQEHPFFRLSWRTNRVADRYESRFDDTFPLRKDIVYYLGAKLPGDAAAALYRDLEKTSFPTLYAATHPADDFAESFANYVHVVLMKRPFAIEITENGRVVKTYGPCWDHERCGAKRRLIEELLR